MTIRVCPFLKVISILQNDLLYIPLQERLQLSLVVNSMWKRSLLLSDKLFFLVQFEELR